MQVLRIGIALLVCAATAAPGWADEKADRLVTAFAKICLAKPDSMSAMNKLAVAQGFALDEAGRTALAKAQREDPFNLLLFWTSGAGENRMKLTGLIDGSADRHELACFVDGYGTPPLGMLAALKPILGEPAKRTVKERNSVELAWTTSGDVTLLTLIYQEGGQGQRVGLSLGRVLGKGAKP
jgi:hypothetical protein